MHRRSLAILAALLAPLAASAQGAAGPKRTRIAVMEIRALATDAAKVELLSEVALTEAASVPGLEVIGKSDISSMIGFEKEKQVAGCTDDSNCLAEVGGALGVDYILVGSLGRIGTLYRLDLKIVDIKKARVRARIGTNVEGSEEKLVVAVQKVVRDLLAPEIAAAALQAPPPKDESLIRPPPPKPLADRPAVREARWRGAAIATAGIGIALVGGGAVVGLQAKSAFQAEKDAAATGDLQGYEDNKAKAKTMSIAADALFVTGAMGVGVGTFLFFKGSAAAGPVSFEVHPTQGGAFASISGGF